MREQEIEIIKNISNLTEEQKTTLICSMWGRLSGLKGEEKTLNLLNDLLKKIKIKERSWKNGLKDKRFNFRMDKEEFENLERLSNQTELNKTELINYLIRKKLKELEDGKNNYWKF